MTEHERMLNIPWWRPRARHRAIRALVTEAMAKDVALREARTDLSKARERLEELRCSEAELMIHRTREEEVRVLRRLTSQHPNTYPGDEGGELGTSRRYCQDASNALWRICKNVVREAADEHADKSEDARVGRMLLAIRNLIVSFTAASYMLGRLHDTLTDDDDLTLALVDFGSDLGAATWERTELSEFKEAIDAGKVIPFRRPS